MTVLTNLIPTLFATVIEPFWIVLNRLLCILQPFHDLRSGKAKPMPTIEARYTAVPPQLAFWQALRAKHFLLALVCIVSLSTNVLAVTLSGLFEEKPTKVLIPGTTKASLAPEIIGEPNLSMNLGGATVITYSDAFYAAMANQSGQASLPPWAGKSRYYLPFDLAWPNNDNITIQRLAANTRAYEFEPNCRPVGINLDTADEYMSFRPFFNDSRWDLAYVRNLPDGTNITCQLFNRNTGLGAFDIENATSAHTIEEVSALQFPDIIGVPAAPEKTFFCSQRMVAGWGRLGPAVDASTAGPEIDLTNSTEGRSLEATWLFCEPKVKSAMFDVEVDVAGRILGANQTTDYTYDSEAFGTSNQTIVDILLKQMNQITLTGLPQSGRWHNDSFSATWFDSLISIELNSARHFEIGSPLPTSEQMLPLFEKWYKRLTAITMSFDKKLFAKLEQDIIIPVTLETIEERIFLEPVMFYLTVSLLGIQLITLIIFYYCRPGQFLPRMPLSIASLISFVSASHAVQEVGRQTEEEQTFGYGRFKGVDGHTHVGIEKSSLVVPLESRNPEARRRRFTWLRRGDERDPRTWI